MDDSSERDHHTASDEEEPHDSAESDESGSEESINAGALLDLEAFESGDEHEDEDEDEDEEVDVDGMSTRSHDTPAYHHSFPQFCRLPIELRQRVWEFFDPDLRAPVRIFDVRFVRDCLWPSGTLDQQTAPARALLEVHSESRQMGLKFYPDKLPILNRKGSLRFHKDRDIILFGCVFDTMDRGFEHWEYIADDMKHVKNLGLEVKPAINLLGVLDHLPFETFASLQAVYPCWDAVGLHSCKLKWCVSDKVHVFKVQTEEEEVDLGEDMELLYCWPDPESQLEYAEKEIPKDFRLGRIMNRDDKPGIEVWPMVLFSSSSGVQRYERLRAKALADPDAAWDSESSSDSEEDPSETDEYESEGIDDGTIDESDEAEEDDDLVVQDDSGDEDDGSGFDGFSPPRAAMALSGDVEAVAHFSSLEPESPNEASSDHPDSEEELVQINKRSRRRVVSSDSEDDSDAESVDEAKKQLRQTNRRAGRVVLSDSDNSDEGENDGVDAKRNGDSESEDSDATADEGEEEEEPDEEPRNSKPVSLAERLQLYRSENPVPQDPADSGSDDAGSDAFNQDFEDDDGLIEGEEYGDDEVSENDLVMDMAEEEFDGDGDGDGVEEW